MITPSIFANNFPSLALLDQISVAEYEELKFQLEE